MSNEIPPRQVHPFEFQLSEDEYRLIERAAAAWKLSVTDFMLDAALEKAIAITEEDVSSHLATVTTDELIPEAEVTRQAAPVEQSSVL